MKPIRPTLLATAILLSATILCPMPTVAAAAERSSALTAALESITGDELRQHVDYLADDAREGREAGTPGGHAAAQYLQTRLAEMGLRGGAADGGYFQPFGSDYRNVLAVLPGSDPELRQETILVGAHFDHVGFGPKKDKAGVVASIHNGADDNASGTSGLLEVAQAFCMLPEAPRRTILFVGWDAEEKGLLGSKHWLDHPTVPLEQVPFVVNLDMIGHLRDQRVIFFGGRSAYRMRRLLSQQNTGIGLMLEFPWGVVANADHFSFVKRDIPAVTFHTGFHEHYHKPTDDTQYIDPAGMRLVSRLAFLTTHELANAEQLPGFRAAVCKETVKAQKQFLADAPIGSDRLGIRWNTDEAADDGVRVTAIIDGSPAARAAIRSGDRVVQVADKSIHGSDDLKAALSMAENPVAVRIQRQGETNPRELNVQLVGNPMRIGISWRVDEADPGSVVISGVVPRSPAARAGLKAGDRIYQVAGDDFDDDRQFLQRITTESGPIQLLIERQGRQQVFMLRIEKDPPKREA